MIEKQFNIAIDADLETTSDGAKAGRAPFNKDLYLLGVRTELTRILKSDAGRHLAASLRYHKKQILLVPYPGQDGNAQEWWWGNSPEDNHSMVRFTPTKGRSPCGAEIRKKQPASLPHEVLFHELVHSLRRISGKMHRFSLWGNGTLSSQGNNEEFIAIMVTNIFISDVTNAYKTGLRDDWLSHSPLDPALAKLIPFSFLWAPRRSIWSRRSATTTQASRRCCPRCARHFNPIAAYYKNRQKAFEMAANGNSENVLAHLPPLGFYKNDKGMWTRLVPFAKSAGLHNSCLLPLCTRKLARIGNGLAGGSVTSANQIIRPFAASRSNRARRSNLWD